MKRPGAHTILGEILAILEAAGRPLARPEIRARFSRPVSDNVLAVTIAQNLFKHISRRPAGKRVREACGARTVYWSKHGRREKHRWIPAERRALRAMYPHMRSIDVGRILGRDVGAVYREANQIGLKKSAAFNESDLNGRIHKGHADRGIGYRFPKGHVPANKGLRRPGWHSGRMRETQFKKGQLNGRAAELFLGGVGALRLAHYKGVDRIEMKVSDTAKGGMAWKAFIRVLWEDEHGPIPPGHVLRSRDGEPFNLELDNYELITNAENLRRNSIHRRYPKELISTINALGQLKRRIRERSERAPREAV